MSYQIAEVDGTAGVTLNSFWGGTECGPCIQITTFGGLHYIQLTTDEAQEMVHLLHDYLQHGTIQEPEK